MTLFNRLEQEKVCAALQVQLDACNRVHLPNDSDVRLAWAIMVRELHAMNGMRENAIAERFRSELECYFEITPGALGKLYLIEKQKEEITNGSRK